MPYANTVIIYAVSDSKTGLACHEPSPCEEHQYPSPLKKFGSGLLIRLIACAMACQSPREGRNQSSYFLPHPSFSLPHTSLFSLLTFNLFQLLTFPEMLFLFHSGLAEEFFSVLSLTTYSSHRRAAMPGSMQ